MACEPRPLPETVCIRVRARSGLRGAVKVHFGETSFPGTGGGHKPVVLVHWRTVDTGKRSNFEWFGSREPFPKATKLVHARYGDHGSALSPPNISKKRGYPPTDGVEEPG